jgi:hypothetical protein
VGSDKRRDELERLLSTALALADARGEMLVALHIAQALEVLTRDLPDEGERGKFH